MNYYLETLKKYAIFKGRATRAEFWYSALFNFLIMTALSILGAVGGVQNPLYLLPVTVYCLWILLPALAVTVRRLHDSNRSGWWILINAVPCVGPIVLFVFLLSPGTPGANAYDVVGGSSAPVTTPPPAAV